MTVTPVSGQSGSDLVTVTVTDTGVSASASFLLTIGVPAPVLPVFTGSPVISNGQIHIRFTGASSVVYAIQTSTNLTSWLSMGVATQTSPDNFDYVDTNAPSSKDRFYRVEQQ